MWTTAGPNPALAGFTGPTPPAGLSFHDRPTWEYRDRDDAVLNRVEHDHGGQNHRTENVVLSHHPVLPFVALTHRWETTHSETTTDAYGKRRTETVTEPHVEKVVEFHPAFRFRAFKVNRGLMGDRVTFEWQAFNEAFTVRCATAKFASDVFHPRQMEYLMQERPLPFEVTREGTILVSCGVDLDKLAFMQEFLLGFFARVPNFVWEGLGYPEPPIAPQ